MLRVLSLFLIFSVALIGTAAAESGAEKVRAAMQKIIPGSEPDSIEPSELKGMYEVAYGAEVFYVSEDGRYLLNGSLLDLSSGKNITEDKRAVGRLKLIKTMDEAKMIVYSPEQVKHSITVFTDIDCPYCRRMHKEMAEMNSQGIEVRYMLFPRAGVNSKSYKKAVAVWCADDRQQALTDAKAGKKVAEKTCDNPIDEHMALVEKLGITGTPTSVLEDGRMIPGYVPVARLVPVLEGEGI